MLAACIVLPRILDVLAGFNIHTAQPTYFLDSFKRVVCIQRLIDLPTLIIRMAQGYTLVVIASDAGGDRLCRPFIPIKCVTLWTWKQ